MLGLVCPVSESRVGVKGLRVIGAMHAHEVGQQSGELVTSGSSITRLTGPSASNSRVRKVRGLSGPSTRMKSGRRAAR